MAESNKLMVDERDRRHRRWKQWLVWCWPMLRVLLQTGAAGAMLSQHEGLALMIGGGAVFLEMGPKHLNRGRGGAGFYESVPGPGGVGGVSRRGQRSPKFSRGGGKR